MRAYAAHAKVNLFLRVAGLRPDGYHDIETVLQTVALADEVVLHPARTGRLAVEFALDVPGPPPEPAEDLALRAARALAARAPGAGAVIEIVKRIPIGSGLGGGSADAAAVLVGLNEMWGCGLSTAELVRIGEGLGSDVPYLVTGGAARATGRGERLEPLPGLHAWFVLGLSSHAVSTARVYALWDDVVAAGAGGDSRDVVAALGAGDVAAVGAALRNDLEVPARALVPDLDARRAVFVDGGALGAVMSGSGPTVFGIAAGEDDARRIAAAVGGRFDRVEAAAAVPRGVVRLD